MAISPFTLSAPDDEVIAFDEPIWVALDIICAPVYVVPPVMTVEPATFNVPPMKTFPPIPAPPPTIKAPVDVEDDTVVGMIVMAIEFTLITWEGPQ